MTTCLRIAAVLSAALLALGLAGCDTSSTVVEPGTGISESLYTQEPIDEQLELIATGMTRALSDRAIRHQIRDAMRASLYVEHKLVLQDYLAVAPDVLAAAARVGMDVESFREVLIAVGDLDFYAPFREHRLTWRGTPNVVVGFTLDVDNPGFATVDLTGNRGRSDARASHPNAVLILHPAEPKDLRTQPQADRPGEVIQDPDDGEAGGSVIVRDEQGNVVSTELLTVTSVGTLEDCDPYAKECLGDGGGGSTPETQLARFVIYYQDGVGSAEVEYTVHDNSHSTTVRFTGISKNVIYAVERKLWDFGFNNTVADNVSLVETDAFSDDFWGYGTVFDQHLGQWRDTTGFCALIGDPNTDVHPECQFEPYITVTSSFQIAYVE